MPCGGLTFWPYITKWTQLGGGGGGGWGGGRVLPTDLL